MHEQNKNSLFFPPDMNRLLLISRCYL